jgi:integrase
MSITKRLRKDGTIAYQARPEVDGRRLPAKTFDRERDAKDYLRRMERRRRRRTGVSPGVHEFVSHWLEAYTVAKRGPTRGRPKDEKTIRTYRYALGSLAEHYGDLRLDEFDRPLARRIAAEYPPSRLVVIRNLFADAYDDGLIDHNPFSDLQLVHSDGRADDQVMPEAALHRLADAALGALGPEYGPMWRTGVLFAAYVGPRAESFCALEWPDVDLAGRTVHFRIVKFDRPYTAILLPHVADELRRLPRRTDLRSVFWSLRGQSLRKGSHFYAWDKVRQAGGMPDLDFHELRHWCGHHFYVTLGFSAEEAGAQLGHKDGRQIVQTYGHGRQGALQRLHRGTERPAEIRSTQTPRATEGEVG